MSRLFDHAGDRLQALHAAAWLVGSLSVIAAGVGYFLFEERRVGPAGAILVAATGPIAGLVLTVLVWRGTGAVSRRLVNAVTAAQGIPRKYEYSRQQALVARGRLTDAAEAYEDHLTEHPDDLDARLHLADLRRQHLGDLDGAERDYLDVRSRGPAPDQEFRLANALIDLYHASGRTGRELAELARFADRFQGTEAGRRAREALRRLKEAGG